MVVAFQPLLPLSGPFSPHPLMLFKSSLPDAAELPASLLPQSRSCQASSALLPLPELPLLLDAAALRNAAVNQPKAQALLWRADAARAGARLLWGGGDQPGQHGPAGLASSCRPSPLPARLLKAKGAAPFLSTPRDDVLPVGSASALRNTASSDRKTCLCALAAAV